MTPRNQRRVAEGFKRKRLAPSLANDQTRGFGGIDYRSLLGSEVCDEIIADAYSLISQGKHNNGADRESAERWNTK